MKRIKVETEAGRVYSTGMDQDGNFIVGNKVIDLKTGNEKALNGANTDSQVFKKLTVTERLLMFPNSTIDLRSTKLSIDSRTRFANSITTNSLTYSTTEQPGFIEIANVAEVIEGTNDKLAVVPATLKAVTDLLETKIGNILDSLVPLGTIIEASTNTAPTWGTWMPADNREISVETYPEYYAALGSPTLSSAPSLAAPLGKYRIPDRRDRVSVGAGGSYSLGSSGGVSSQALSLNQIPLHTHTADHSHTGSQSAHTHTADHSHTGSQSAHTHTSDHSHTASTAPHTHTPYLAGGRLRGYNEGNGANGDGAELTIHDWQRSGAVYLRNSDEYVQVSIGTESVTTSSASPSLSIDTASVTTSSADSGLSIETASVTTSPAGSGNPVNNMQPYLVHNHFVRVK